MKAASFQDTKSSIIIGKDQPCPAFLPLRVIGETREKFPVNSPDMQNEIQLVYQGPEDESPDTIRKIKSTFVADLNYSIDETRKFIEEPPCVVISTIDEDLVQKMYDMLQAAGAKVLLVKPEMVSDEEDKELLEEPVLIKSRARKEEPEAVDDDEGPQTFEIELDLSAPVGSEQSSKKVYDLKEEAAKKPQKEVKPPEKKKEEEPMFSFEEISKALEESQKAEEKPVDNLKTSLVDEPAEEFDLSFDDSPAAAHKKESVRPKVETPAEEKSTGKFADAEELPEIVMEGEAPAPVGHASSPSEQPGLETSVKPEKSAEKRKTSMPRLSDLAAQRASLPVKESAQAGGTSPAGQSAPPDDSEEYNWSREKPLWREIGVPIVVLGALMGAGTWYYFNYFAPPPPVVDTDALARTVSAPSAVPAETALPESTATPVPSNRMKGRRDLADRSLSAEIVLEGETIKSIRVEVSTMPPPPLTPEQIVRGEKQKPWLKRVEIEDTVLTFESQNDFSGNTPAKAYVDNDKQSTRVIATAALSGSRVGRNEISLHVEVSYNTAGNPLAEKEIIRRAEDGGVAFSISGDVTVTR